MEEDTLYSLLWWVCSGVLAVRRAVWDPGISIWDRLFSRTSKGGRVACRSAGLGRVEAGEGVVEVYLWVWVMHTGYICRDVTWRQICSWKDSGHGGVTVLVAE